VNKLHESKKTDEPRQRADFPEPTRREFLEAQPTPIEGFLSFEQLLPKLPVGERSARQWTRLGILPSIRLPGSRRVIYHWPSVERALLRLQRGGDV
jgi:hypothetical protein